MLWVSLLTFLAGTILYFPIKEMALKTGIVDNPDGELKRHERATPYLGGLVVFGAFITGIIIEIYFLHFPFEAYFKGLVIGAAFIVFLGILDDMYRMSWVVKLLGQLLLVVIMLSYDIEIDFDFLPSLVNIFITVLWMMFIINAYNIIDVADGVSGITFLVFLSASAIIAFFTGEKDILLLVFPLIGGTLAFLVFNMPTARIFAGDGGSMFFGFIVGVVSIRLTYTSFNRLSNLAPLIISVYPLMETALVVFSRFRRGLSPFHGSPHHFPIRLKKRGFSPLGIFLNVAVISLAGAAGGVLSVFIKGYFPLIMGLFSAVLILIAILIIDLREKT